MYMLDTNTCIYAQKGHLNILKKLNAEKQNGIFISVMTLAELQYGVENSNNKEKNSLALMRFLSIMTILPFDRNAAAEYAAIRASLRKKGTPIGTMDMLIAAHAKSEGLTIVTHNTKEFERVDGLAVEDWY